MVPKTKDPADLIKYYTDQIMIERDKMMEALRTIAEYAEELRRITTDTTRKLLTRD